METVRIIKKYPNRRLYDTTIGAYITLADIKKLVIAHIPFEVVDARTHKNLTHSTLLQIISEQETTSTPLFTANMLQDFIRFYHEKSQNLFNDYLEETMQLFMQQQALFKKQADVMQKIWRPKMKKPVKKPKIKKKI